MNNSQEKPYFSIIVVIGCILAISLVVIFSPPALASIPPLNISGHIPLKIPAHTSTISPVISRLFFDNFSGDSFIALNWSADNEEKLHPKQMSQVPEQVTNDLQEVTQNPTLKISTESKEKDRKFKIYVKTRKGEIVEAQPLQLTPIPENYNKERREHPDYPNIISPENAANYLSNENISNSVITAKGRPYPGYDWVGLAAYKGDVPYVCMGWAELCWQWAVRGSSYTTNVTPYSASQQGMSDVYAIYFIWDATQNMYVGGYDTPEVSSPYSSSDYYVLNWIKIP